eukprot:scpid104641/ scgid30138/ 
MAAQGGHCVSHPGPNEQALTVDGESLRHRSLHTLCALATLLTIVRLHLCSQRHEFSHQLPSELVFEFFNLFYFSGCREGCRGQSCWCHTRQPYSSCPHIDPLCGTAAPA